MEALTPKQFLERYFDQRPEEVDIPESLKELKNSAEDISEEEKQRRREELEDMDSSDLWSEFGLS